MAIAQVINMGNTVESARIGHQRMSLTHYDDNLEPAVSAGSVVEVGGALYEAAADEPITGLAAIAPSSQVYIKLTVAGASVTASGTVVAPTWSTSAQGWFIGLERVIGGLYKDAGGNYVQKWLYGQSHLKALTLGWAPVGAIIAWHKDFPNTPTLPRNWVECNGQVLADAESPYNGQTIPDLNATGRFIRGGVASGTLQAGSTALPASGVPYMSSAAGAIPGRLGVSGGNGSYPAWDAETRPINISMVWIMRVK